MANTFISLTDTPSQYDETQTQVVITAGDNLDFVTFSTNELVDVNTFGAYAPVNGQVLTYFGGVNEWRPATSDPYSAGNGLNKTNGTLNINIANDGGLLANSQGIFIEPIAGVEGTYGNATHVPSFTVNNKGQITSASFVLGSFEVANELTANHIRDIAGTAGQIVISGGTGVAANAVASLVSTGVTPGTYGNATYSPVITVDTYGRIQNVDLIQNIGGGGGGNSNVDLNVVATEAFKNIAVAGQTTITADTKDDTLTFVAGTGIAITTAAGSDTITFTSTASGGASVTVSDSPPGSPDSGDLWWDSSVGKLKIYYEDVDSSQWVDASPGGGGGGGASVTASDTPPTSPSDGDLWWDSSVGRLKIFYADSDSTQWVDASPTTTLTTIADLTDGALTLPQSNTVISSGEGRITWNFTTDTLHVGDGSSYVTVANIDDLDLAWDEGNATLSIAGGNSIALTGLGGASYGNVQVQAYLDTQGYSNVVYGNADVQAYLDTQGYANADSDAQTLTLNDGGAGNLTISNGNTVDLRQTQFLYNAVLDLPAASNVHGAIAHVHAEGALYFAHSGSWNRLANQSELYANADVQAYLDTQGYSNVDSDSQTLSWDEANSNISISGGNTVTLTGVGGGYGNVNVQNYLDDQGYSNVDSDSQTLTWDSGNSNLSISGGNTVTLTGVGGGTPGGSDGQIQFNNSGSFGGIADLYWDDSNDRLGIGTSSPAVKLHISGDAAQESQLRMSQYNSDADAPDIRFFKARGTEASPSDVSISDKLAAINVEARTGGAFKEMGTISFVSSSTNTGASVLKFGTKSNSQAGNLYPSTKFEITEEGNIKFNNTYTFPSSDGSAGQVLQTDGSGTLSFATISGSGITAVVDDTTPQLGGNLDINSKFITGALIPDTNNTYDLGTAELKWRDLYLNSGSIYLGDVVLSSVANVLQANVEGILKNVSFGGDPVVTSTVKPETTNTEAVDGTVTNVTGGDANGINSTGGDLVIDGGVGAIGNGSIKVGTVSTATIDIGGASTTTTINGQTTFTNDARFDTGVEEKFSTINAATGTVVHDCDNGHIFRHTAPVADWTANFTNLGLTNSYATTVTLVIDQGATAFIPTAVQIGGVAQTLLWQGGSPPTGTNNGEDVVSFSILNSGGTYTVLGQLVGFS